MTKNRKQGVIAIVLLTVFVVFTVVIKVTDVATIGPNGSAVGFSTINGWFHRLTGVNFTLYTVTDWLGLLPIAVCAGFGVLGLLQWIKRKRLLKVDRSLLVLGGFYIVVIAVYGLFEEAAINYRPVLIDGYLESSYPSSTTLLVLCVMPTALMQCNARIRNDVLRWCVVTGIVAFTAFMVVGRLVSGVHWLTDIVGGVLLSAGLVTGYRALTK